MIEATCLSGFESQRPHMNFIPYHGFLVYEKYGFDHSNVFIAQHAGPSIGSGRDTNSDKLAFALMRELGGNLVVSTLPRNPVYGIDYNRMAPDAQKAIEYYKKWETGSDISSYTKKYAWVAKDKKEHKMKERMFKTFWNSIKNLGYFYVFLHTSMALAKNYPSAIDIISFGGEGVDKKVLEKVVTEMNKKYMKFFNRIKRNYTMLTYKYLQTKYKFHEMDMRFLKSMFKNVNKNNYLKLAKKVLSSDAPKITLDTKFTGQLAYGPKTELYIGENNVVLEIEVNEIFSEFYFEDACEILKEIIQHIKRVKKYQMLGFTQTQILQFIKYDREKGFSTKSVSKKS